MSITPADRDTHGLKNAEPGVRFAWDFDLRMSRACGAVPRDAEAGAPTAVNRVWILVDPSLHILATWPMATTPVEAVLRAVAVAGAGPVRRAGAPGADPMIPNVLAPELCRRLIAAYRASGGEESVCSGPAARCSTPGSSGGRTI